MSWFLAAATTAWLTAAAAMALLLLPVAAVARLLPIRLSRLAAVLWAAVGAGGIVCAILVVLNLPTWATHHLQYTPHLERPLPHFCLAEAVRLLGEGSLRVASLVALLLWLLGLGRLFLSAVRSMSLARSLAATAVPLSNPFSPRVFSVSADSAGAGNAFSPRTVGFFRPMVVVPAAAVGHIPPEAAAAVLLHELDHAYWRDPATALALSALAWTFPGLGLVILRQWRVYSERAADVAAARRAGSGALAQALALSGRYDVRNRHGISVADAVLDRSSPALAAAIGWLLLLIAGWPVVYPRLLMTLVCTFETTASVWR